MVVSEIFANDPTEIINLFFEPFEEAENSCFASVDEENIPEEVLPQEIIDKEEKKSDEEKNEDQDAE